MVFKDFDLVHALTDKMRIILLHFCKCYDGLMICFVLLL